MSLGELFVGRLRAPLVCAAFGVGYVVAQPLVGGPTDPLADPIVVEGGRAKLERSFDVLCRTHAASVVRVVAASEVGPERISHAVAVDANHVLAKLSELGSLGFHLVDGRGERLVGLTVATDLDSDLALIEVEDVLLEPLELTDEPVDWRVGRWIGAAGPGGSCIAVGSVSVGPREIPLQTHGLLGVILGETGAEGSRISELVDGGSAIAAGLRVDDVILNVDGVDVRGVNSTARQLRRTRPGQEVALTIERAGDVFERVIRMGGRQLDDYGTNPWYEVPRHTADTVTVSVRRDGFELAVQHDAHLAPSECLSPAVDVRGRVVGLHIARMDRPGSLLLPADVVREALRRLREQASEAAAGSTRDV